MFKKILLAYDGSKGAERALAAAIELAQVHGAELTAMAVQERLPRFSGTIDEVQEEKEFANQQSGRLLDGAQAQSRAAGVKLQTLMRPGHPAKTILVCPGFCETKLLQRQHSCYSSSAPLLPGLQWEPVSTGKKE